MQKKTDKMRNFYKYIWLIQINLLNLQPVLNRHLLIINKIALVKKT